MPLKVDRSTLDSGVECLTLAGNLTLGRDAQQLEWTVEELIKNQKTRIVFNLAEVSYVDSAGIGILVGCHGRAEAAGGQLRITGLAERVTLVLKVTKVDSILNIDPTFEDSVRNFG